MFIDDRIRLFESAFCLLKTKLEKEKSIDKIKRFRLMDDTFMSAVFDENKEATEIVLRTVLGRDDIFVKSVTSQFEIKNLVGRSVRLDILAIDSGGKYYNIEVQRSDAGADPRRSRFNSAMLDSRMLYAGEKFSDLKDSYVIFITENDTEGLGWPLYYVDRVIQSTKRQFCDGNHIIYVNGEYIGDDAVGKLIHDFKCTDADDMYFRELAKYVRYFKESERGQKDMCEIMEDMIVEERKTIARSFWDNGLKDIHLIAESTKLSEETVKEVVSAEGAALL